MQNNYFFGLKTRLHITSSMMAMASDPSLVPIDLNEDEDVEAKQFTEEEGDQEEVEDEDETTVQ